jgi:DNA repair protein RadC
MSTESTIQIAYAITKRKKTCDPTIKKADPTSFNMTIKDLPAQYRPQNRVLVEGTMALSTAELLSLIIRSGSKAENAINLSHRILSQFDLRQLSVAPISQIMKIYGIKIAKASQIAACFEISRRLEVCGKEEMKKINSPEDVYRMLYPGMREIKKEMFIELCLDTKNQLIKQETISIGSLNANIVHPREVFKVAIQASSAALIFAHNHPSGDPTPSKEDLVITKKLVETGNIMGISVLDHVIIGDGGRHFSMKEAGHI